MTWADILIALDALFVLPALSASLVLAWTAANAAETIMRSNWPKSFDSRWRPAALEKPERWRLATAIDQRK